MKMCINKLLLSSPPTCLLVLTMVELFYLAILRYNVLGDKGLSSPLPCIVRDSAKIMQDVSGRLQSLRISFKKLLAGGPCLLLAKHGWLDPLSEFIKGLSFIRYCLVVLRVKQKIETGAFLRLGLHLCRCMSNTLLRSSYIISPFITEKD